jgi:hypothetical protein
VKKLTFILSACVAIIFMIAATPGKSSSGAPPSHSGAPDEKTCATSGCHDDNTANTGTAELSINIGKSLTKYEAGKTYPIKIQIKDKKKMRFGFQITALSANSNSSIGEFKIVDAVRTQLVNNAYELKERNYVTYTFNGTDAVSKGKGEWIVNWTAPTNTNDEVVFYVAGVSANDDMSDKGDHVYTTSLKLNKQ